MLNLEFLFMNIIIGTAGHIDHGKTALVKALTGIDADRLPEEKKRGITIDLGFAELNLGNLKIGFVDVPGHERFVKNMLAGASGIDLVMLVIAADEGVMPQTREHFEICRLLETKAGVIVLTKKDTVDDELLELVKLEAAELVQNSFLENALMIAVSAKTGEGIDELKSQLKNLGCKIPQRKNETIARLPVDRSFTVKGFGTVVTGTLASGEIRIADETELLPLGKKVRVRGLQTHGTTTETVCAGQRAAINLGGIDYTEIERGQTLVPTNWLKATQIFDAEIEVLKDAGKSLKSRQRVRVHLGTSEILARVQIINKLGEIPPGEKDFAQFRLESPIVALPNERFIVRSYSPQMTIAGGVILDNSAHKHRRKDYESINQKLAKFSQSLKSDDKQAQIKIYLESASELGLNFSDLRARTGYVDAILSDVLKNLIDAKSVIEAEKVYVGRTQFDNLAAKTLRAIQFHHKSEPLSRGMLRETLREKVFAKLTPEIFKKTLQILTERGEITNEKDVVRIELIRTQNLKFRRLKTR
jgi:selenocysteine-specific elongation factor